MRLLSVHEDDPAAPAQRLERLYTGAVFADAPRPASGALAAWVLDRFREAFPEAEPERVQQRVAGAAFFERLTALRRELRESPELLPRVRALLESDGWELEGTYFDRLRLRAVASGAWRDPAARHAYVVHRDTWYANPPAQANLWLALTDVAAEEAFGFFPEAFERGVPNSSEAFDYDRWCALGGWQVPNDDKHYPAPHEPVAWLPHRVPRTSGGTLLFSGSHLHGTLGHDSGRTRLSIELRLVRIDDVLAVQPRRNLDNRSRGTTLGDLLRASDFSPFPPELARLHAERTRSLIAAGSR